MILIHFAYGIRDTLGVNSCDVSANAPEEQGGLFVALSLVANLDSIVDLERVIDPDKFVDRGAEQSDVLVWAHAFVRGTEQAFFYSPSPSPSSRSSITSGDAWLAE